MEILTHTCFETTSTNMTYWVFILLKSLPPGALEKSSLTDQMSFLIPPSICLWQNCLSIAKPACTDSESSSCLVLILCVWSPNKLHLQHNDGSLEEIKTRLIDEKFASDEWVWVCETIVPPSIFRVEEVVERSKVIWGTWRRTCSLLKGWFCLMVSFQRFTFHKKDWRDWS